MFLHLQDIINKFPWFCSANFTRLVEFSMCLNKIYPCNVIQANRWLYTTPILVGWLDYVGLQIVSAQMMLVHGWAWQKLQLFSTKCKLNKIYKMVLITDEHIIRAYRKYEVLIQLKHYFLTFSSLRWCSLSNLLADPARVHDHQLHRKLRLRQLLNTLLYNLFVLVAYGEGVVLLLTAWENEVLVLVAGDSEVRVEGEEVS